MIRKIQRVCWRKTAYSKIESCYSYHLSTEDAVTFCKEKWESIFSKHKVTVAFAETIDAPCKPLVEKLMNTNGIFFTSKYPCDLN